MTRIELIDAVPVHWHAGRPYFVRLAEIPEPWRGQFLAELRGSATPALPGEGQLAHVQDWLDWVNGRWPGRTGPADLEEGRKC